MLTEGFGQDDPRNTSRAEARFAGYEFLTRSRLPMRPPLHVMYIMLHEDEAEVEKAINFWVNHGVLEEVLKGKYTLIEVGGAQAEEAMAGHERE